MRDDFFALFFAVLFHLILAVSYWFFSKNTLIFVSPATPNYQVIEAELLIDQVVEFDDPPPPLPVVETPVVETVSEPVVVQEPDPVIQEPDESAQLALLELKKQDLAKIEAEAERKQIEEQKRKEAAERKRIEEQKRKEEAERKRIQEQKRKEAVERKQVEEQKRKEEAERKQIEEQKRKEAAERKRKEEQKRKEETERKRKEAAAAAAAKAQADAAAAEGTANQARVGQRVGQVMALIQQRVKQRWIRPPNTSNTLSCIIEVRLLPDGTVGSASVVKSSGNTVFDRSAEQAIRSASPLPVSISQNADVFDKFRQFRFKFDASQ
jgi:colicin import membrane protein